MCNRLARPPCSRCFGESAQALGQVVRWTRVSGCYRLSYKTSRALANLEIIRPQLTTDIILNLDNSERPLRKNSKRYLPEVLGFPIAQMILEILSYPVNQPPRIKHAFFKRHKFITCENRKNSTLVAVDSCDSGSLQCHALTDHIDATFTLPPCKS